MVGTSHKYSKLWAVLLGLLFVVSVSWSAGLWDNVKHLGIYGGTYDYNASLGVNGYSSFNMMNGLTLAAGYANTCYILSNGNSLCYGPDGNGKSINYTGGDAIAVSAGYASTCYLRSNGNSTCYGYNGQGQSTNYTGGDAIAVSVHYFYHTCYLLSNGSSICYGDSTCDGNSPCIGSGGESTNYTGTNAIAVSTGNFNTCYLLSNGNSTCYGYNWDGQSTNYTGGNAIAVSAGQSHTCYLLSTGNSVCYGDNGSGRSTPYVGGDAIAVAAGDSHTCYLLSNGNSVCYGDNGLGQSTSYTGGNAIAIAAAGGSVTCYLLSNGNSTCYGWNSDGQATNYTGGNLKIPFALASYPPLIINFTAPTPASGTTLASTSMAVNVTLSANATGCNLTLNSTTYAMSVLNASAATYANYTLTALSDGFYIYHVNCSSTSASNYTETRNVTVALPSPAVTLGLPANASTVATGNVTFGFTAVDNLSATLTCFIYIDGILNRTNGSFSNNTPGNFTIANIRDGTHTWQVGCNNSANKTGASQLWRVTVDITVPAVTLNSPANLSVFNVSGVAFNFTAVDNLSSTMACSIYLDGILNRTNGSFSNNTPGNFTIAGIRDGTHTWQVRCNDSVNNTGTSPTRTFITGTTVPVVILNSPTNHSTFTVSTITFNFTATSNVFTTLNCSLYLDNALNMTNASVSNGTATVFPLSGIAQGRHTWQVRCTDSANNTGSSEQRTVSRGSVEQPSSPLPPAGCTGNNDCTDAQACSGGACVAVTCSCGTVQNHQCVKNACCADSDCAANQVCSSGSCVAVQCACGALVGRHCVPYACCSDSDCGQGSACRSNACVPAFECVSDSQCPAGKYCDLSQGLAGGSCKKKPAQPQENQTQQQNISAPANATTGKPVTLTVTNGSGPCAYCELTWVSPSGVIIPGRTDANGKFTLPIVEAGTYKVTLGRSNKTISIIAAAAGAQGSPSEATSTPLPSAASSILVGLLVVAAAGAAVIIYLKYIPHKGK